MSRYFVALLFISSICLSQVRPDSLTRFHNGRTASRYHYKTADTIERVDFYKNGRTRDSAWFRIETLVGFRESPGQAGQTKDSIVLRHLIPFGVEKKYYRKGTLASVTWHNEGAARSYEYRKKGSVSAYKEEPYGVKLYFNKKGTVTRYMDLNKKSYVTVPKAYRHKDFLKTIRFEGRVKNGEAVFISGNNTMTLERGALISIRLSADTTLIRHCLVNGFSGDSLCISKFSYDLSDSKNKLKYDTTLMLPLAELKSIAYSKYDRRKTYRMATIFEVTGFDMVLAPLIAVPLFAGAVYLGNPVVLGIIVAGVPVFIYSKVLHRKMAPKNYKLSEWKIRH